MPRSRRMPPKARLVLAMVIAIAAVVAYLSTSQENPLTGEAQRVALTTDQEIALGMKAAPKLMRQFGGADNDRFDQLKIKTLGSVIVDAMLRHENRPNPYEFEFTLLADANTVNAFALPGGRIFITRALFDRLETDAQIVGVLAHEVGHVVHRHGAEHLAQQQLAQGLVSATAVATDRADAASAAAVIASLINLKYGREDELECDAYGLILMAEAGYDPRAMIDVMKVLAGSSDGSAPEWASTHPDPGNRIQRIEQTIRDLRLEARPRGPDAPGGRVPPIEPPATSAGPSPLDAAIANRSSGVWVTDAATVVRLLPDDNEGSRHQRFIVREDDGRTILIAHNIDLAPRVPVQIGDPVRFRGEYEWNDKGGVVHWTHHDPDGSQRGGWIEHRGKTYR